MGIGFGDYSPGKAFEGFQDDPVAFMKMCFTVVYCIFGMTLISMCMNLMQEQIAEKVSWVAEELGMKGDGNDEEVVNLSREGKVTITPPDKDGNVNSFGNTKKKHHKKKKTEEPSNELQDSQEQSIESPVPSPEPIGEEDYP